MANRAHKKRVFVGMSGGVDSSVSATLLKKNGYDITAVFIKVWQPEWMACTWREERREAMRAAAHLDIPFFTLNLEDEYKKNVIDYMIREYREGKTPNPDVMCNRYVKFDAFWKWAKEQGADFIATGHYAQVTGHSRPRSLYAGVDKNKDQSYFLWTLNQNDLEHVLFPIGHLKKSTVREIARKNNLPNADKRDSQGLCFIGKVDLKDFLSRYIKAADGNVLDEKGEKIGRHPGATLFTIGERHGFTITDKTPNDSPYFVIDKDIEQNTITVSNKNRERPLLGATNIATITRVNWVSGAIPSFGDDIAKTANNSSSDNDNTHYPLQVRGRYREPLQKARIKKITFSEVTIEFQKIQETLSPGQSLVIYNGEECLGGGIIE